MMAVLVAVIVRMVVPVVMGVIVAVVMGMAVLVMFVVGVLETRHDSHLGGRLRIELPADQQHQDRAEEREQGNQPDLIEKVHITT